MNSFERVCEFEGLIGKFLNCGIHLRKDKKDHSVFFINNQIKSKYNDIVLNNHITYEGEAKRNKQLIKYVDDYHKGITDTPRTIRVYEKTALATCVAITNDGYQCTNKCYHEFCCCGKHSKLSYPPINKNKRWVNIGEFALTYYHRCDENNNKIKFSLVSTQKCQGLAPIDFDGCLD
jgi:hypothetical protein